MSYLAYLLIPYDSMDLVRHYEAWEILSKTDFSNITIAFPRLINYGLYLYMWTLSHLGFNKEFIPLSFAFIIYMMYFMSLKIIINLPKVKYYIYQKKYVLIGLFLIFSEIRFIGGISGLRNDLAFAITVYALILFFIQKRIFFPVFLFLIAAILHISILPLLVILFLSQVIKNTGMAKIIFIVSLIILLSGFAGDIFFWIIKIFEPFLRANNLYFYNYMDPNGAWGVNYFASGTKSDNLILYEKYIKPLPFYIAGAYLFYSRKTNSKNIIKYLFILFAAVSMLSISRTFFDRYSYFFVLFFIFYLLIDIGYAPLKKTKRIVFFLFLISLLINNLAGIMRYRYVIVKSWSSILYTPVPINMLKSVNPQDYIKFNEEKNNG